MLCWPGLVGGGAGPSLLYYNAATSVNGGHLRNIIHTIIIAPAKPALAPNWVPPDSSSPMAREFPVWIIAVLCLVLLVAGFVLARTSLEEVSSATSNSLKKLMSSE